MIPCENPNPVQFTQGDDVVINLVATDGNGTPVNLTGATFSSYMVGSDNVLITFTNESHVITDAALGMYNLILTSMQSSSVGTGFNKSINSLVTISGTAIMYRGYRVMTVYSPIPPT